MVNRRYTEIKKKQTEKEQIYKTLPSKVNKMQTTAIYLPLIF